MENYFQQKQTFDTNGFLVINAIYTSSEIEHLISVVESATKTNANFRQSTQLFAIRQFLKEIPQAIPLIFNTRLTELIHSFFASNYFVVKSIYFDKPQQSNWFVAYHQDLTISVNKKVDAIGYQAWTVKQNQFAVQPPLPILENNFTIRIHLDNTDETNGALNVITGSHLKGIYRPQSIDWTKEKETSCPVSEGGVMVMRPLLLHSSNKTTTNHKRRVIHIEFSNQTLANDLKWVEYLNWY
jgi:hypothetical protein